MINKQQAKKLFMKKQKWRPQNFLSTFALFLHFTKKMAQPQQAAPTFETIGKAFIQHFYNVFDQNRQNAVGLYVRLFTRTGHCTGWSESQALQK